MAQTSKKTLTGVHVNQYDFWSKLQKTNPSIYKKAIKGQHFYDLPISNNGWIIRLDIYFRKGDYNKKGHLTLAVMNKDQQLFDNNKGLVLDCFENDGNMLTYEDLYRKKYHRLVVGTKNPDYYLSDHQKWDNAIEWFNTYVYEVKKVLHI